MFIRETEQDKLLVGGNYGLRELDLSDGILRDFSGYNQYDQLRNITFYDAIPFADGQWGLCSHVGIYIYDPDKGIVGDFTDLPIQSVNHFYEDEEGVIWLATNGDGLLRWDRRNNTVKAFKMHNNILDK